MQNRYLSLLLRIITTGLDQALVEGDHTRLKHLVYLAVHILFEPLGYWIVSLLYGARSPHVDVVFRTLRAAERLVFFAENSTYELRHFLALPFRDIFEANCRYLQCLDGRDPRDF